MARLAEYFSTNACFVASSCSTQPPLHREDHAVVGQVDPAHLARQLVALEEVLPGVLDGVDAELADRDEPFELVVHQHHHAAIDRLGDDRLHDRVDRVPIEELRPRILADLLEAEADPALVLVDGEDLHVDLLSLLQHLGRMVDPPRPGHVGDVDQAVDAVLQLDEGAEVRQVADLARR